MELKDTINMMISEDYKERFKAEYFQNKIRLDKLTAMLEKWDKNELNFKPTCPRSLYDLQVRSMKDNIAVLEARAAIEKIDLVYEELKQAQQQDSNQKEMKTEFQYKGEKVKLNKATLTYDFKFEDGYIISIPFNIAYDIYSIKCDSMKCVLNDIDIDVLCNDKYLPSLLCYTKTDKKYIIGNEDGFFECLELTELLNFLLLD